MLHNSLQMVFFDISSIIEVNWWVFPCPILFYFLSSNSTHFVLASASQLHCILSPLHFFFTR